MFVVDTTVFVPCERGNKFLNIISIKSPTDIITPQLHIHHLQATLNRRANGLKPVSLEKSNTLSDIGERWIGTYFLV
jgi:hypothetical protein